MVSTSVYVIDRASDASEGKQGREAACKDAQISEVENRVEEKLESDATLLVAIQIVMNSIS